MDYINNYAQIGGYGLSMPAPQLYYPEMSGGKGYEHGSAMDIMNPRYDSIYKDDYKQGQERIRDVPSNYYEGGDYKHNQKSEPIDFYDGGDYNRSSNRNYGSQHYAVNSASGYRSYARQNRLDKEMLARNGLFSPRDSYGRNNGYPSYSDDIGHSGSRSTYWH